MTKLDRTGEARTVLLAMTGAAMFIAVALVAAPKPAHGGDAESVGTSRLVVVGEVLVAADESPDGPGVSEPVLAAAPVEAHRAR